MSGDSVLLCTGGYDRQIRIWEATTGMCNRELDMGDSHINALAVSPKKTWLAAAGNPSIKIFDVVKGTGKKSMRNLEGHTNNVVSIGFPDDERWMYSASEDGTVKVWDIKNGTVIQERKIHDSKRVMLSCAVLHPNQGEIVVGDESGTISVWDLSVNRIRTSFQCESKTVPIRALSVSASGSMVVATHKGVCYAYKPSALSSGGVGAADAVDEIELEPSAAAVDSTSGVGGGDDEKTGEFTQWLKWQAHDTYCLSTRLSPDGKILATSSADNTIKLWDASGSYSLISTLKGHTKWVWDMAFSADSVYMVSGVVRCFLVICASLRIVCVFCACIASSDKTAALWDLNNGNVLVEYGSPQKRAVTCVALKD